MDEAAPAGGHVPQDARERRAQLLDLGLPNFGGFENTIVRTCRKPRAQLKELRVRANRHGEDVEKREGRGLRRSAGEIEQLRCGFPQPELSSFCTARLSLFCMAGLS